MYEWRIGGWKEGRKKDEGTRGVKRVEKEGLSLVDTMSYGLHAVPW